MLLVILFRMNSFRNMSPVHIFELGACRERTKLYFFVCSYYSGQSQLRFISLNWMRNIFRGVFNGISNYSDKCSVCQLVFGFSNPTQGLSRANISLSTCSSSYSLLRLMSDDKNCHSGFLWNFPLRWCRLWVSWPWLNAYWKTSYFVLVLCSHILHVLWL